MKTFDIWLHGCGVKNIHSYAEGKAIESLTLMRNLIDLEHPHIDVTFALKQIYENAHI